MLWYDIMLHPCSHPQSLLVCLAIRGGVVSTTFKTKAPPKKSEAKAKDPLFEDRPSRGQGEEWSRPRPRTKATIFLNYGQQTFNYF